MSREQKKGYEVFPLFPDYNQLRNLDLKQSEFVHSDDSSINKVKKYINIYKQSLESYLDCTLNTAEEQGFKIENNVDSFYDLAFILSNDEKKNKSFENTIRELFVYYILDFYNSSKSPFYQMSCMKGIEELIEKKEKEKLLENILL